MRHILTNFFIFGLCISAFAQQTSTGSTLLTPNGNSIKTSSLKIGDGSFSNTAKLYVDGVGEQYYSPIYPGYISQFINAQPTTNLPVNSSLMGLQIFVKNNNYLSSSNNGIISISEGVSNGSYHPTNYGVRGYAWNKGQNNRSINIGIFGYAAETTGWKNLGLSGYASNSYMGDNIYDGKAYGIWSAVEVDHKSSGYGAYILANSLSFGSKPLYGIFSDVYGNNTSLSSKYGLYSNVESTNNTSYGISATSLNNYQADTSTWRGSSYGIFGLAKSYKASQTIGIDGYAIDLMPSNFYKSISGIRGIAVGNFYNKYLTVVGIEGYAFSYYDNGIVDDNNKIGAILASPNGNGIGTSIGLQSYATSNNLPTAKGTVYGINTSASSHNPANTSNVYGISTSAYGLSSGTKYGVYSEVDANAAGTKYAGFFQGNVHVNGMLSKSGGSFKIDHPQDPQNKYLVHSFVESPEMKNIYDGITTTDANGNATVTMPSYFETLNVTFRYQLTCIGQFAQAIIFEEITGNQFKIKTDKPNVKVSWQVTGVRNDAWAKENPIIVEQEKETNAKGKYLNPEVFKQARSMAIHASEDKKTDYDAENKIRTAEYQREENSRNAIQLEIEATRKQEAEQRQKVNLQQPK